MRKAIIKTFKEIIRIIVILFLLGLGCVLISEQVNAQSKTAQLMTRHSEWIGSLTINKASNRASFGLKIENKTEKYILLYVTVYDEERIVFKDYIRVGRDYVNTNAFFCYNKLRIEVAQRVGVKRVKHIDVMWN